PEPFELAAPVRLYALRRLLGPKPDGVASGVMAGRALTSVRRNELHAITCAFVGSAQDRTVGWFVAAGVAADAGVATSAAAVNASPPMSASTGVLTRMSILQEGVRGCLLSMAVGMAEDHAQYAQRRRTPVIFWAKMRVTMR